MFLIVLYVCKPWCLTLWEVHKLTVLRRIFGPVRDEVIGSWRELHNGGLRNSYFSPNITKTIKLGWLGLAWHLADFGKRRIHKLLRS
jgi:hypothetical protein